MKTLPPLIALALAAGSAWAEPAGDAKTGKTLMEKARCDGCHVSMFGGDGSGIYTRPNRLVTNSRQLVERVRVCNTFAKANWFPEEEAHVVAYLNQKYYKFK